MQARVDQLEKQVADYKALIADFENARKRLTQDADRQRRYAAEPLVRDLLGGLDNLDRAVQAATQAGESGALVQGVTATVSLLLDALKRHGAGDKQIEIVRAPGAFDMPLVARKLAQSRKYDAIVALGAVIKGATAHFDYVAGECAGGLARVSQDTGVPIAFGVLTTDTIEQAIERAGTKAGNKGADAAVSAIELANLLRRIES